jgi:glyoxylase-like metal-dependent hydrolase (beta-lactamase superfamily II)
MLMNDTDDWFEVEQLDEDTWRITEATIFNDYLLAGEDRALVLDGSVGVGDLRAMVESLVDVPVEQILTHTHWDHMGTAHQFEDVRVHPAERTPTGGVRADYVADEFNYSLGDWLAQYREGGGEFPDGFESSTYEIRSVDSVGVAEGGETVDLGGRELELLHLPGQAPGQLGALDRERGVLYGGDVVHIEYSLFIHFEGCDIHDYVETFARLRDLRDDGAFDTLYTAHNRPLSGDELSILDDFHEGLQAILEDDLDWEPNDDHPPGRVYDVAGHEVVTKPDVT